MDWMLPLDAIDMQRAVQLRQKFVDCCGDIAANGCNADTVASAVGKHIASVTSADLPPAARLLWLERVARPLKADPEKRLTERAVGAIRSWPSARANELGAALIELEAIIAEAENEAHHEAIYAEISRTYS